MAGIFDTINELTRYGNWGGKNYSGGKVVTDQELPDISVVGEDILDKAYKAHDMNIFKAQNIEDVRAADKALIDTIEGLIGAGKLSSTALHHANAARTFFSGKHTIESVLAALGVDTYKDSANVILDPHHFDEAIPYDSLSYMKDDPDERDLGWFLGDDPDSLPTEEYGIYDYQTNGPGWGPGGKGDTDLSDDVSPDTPTDSLNLGAPNYDEARFGTPYNTLTNTALGTQPGDQLAPSGPAISVEQLTQALAGIEALTARAAGPTASPAAGVTTDVLGNPMGPVDNRTAQQRADAFAAATQAQMASAAKSPVSGIPSVGNLGAAYPAAEPIDVSASTLYSGALSEPSGKVGGNRDSQSINGQNINGMGLDVYGVEPDNFIDAYTQAHNEFFGADTVFGETTPSASPATEQSGNKNIGIIDTSPTYSGKSSFHSSNAALGGKADAAPTAAANGPQPGDWNYSSTGSVGPGGFDADKNWVGPDYAGVDNPMNYDSVDGTALGSDSDSDGSICLVSTALTETGAWTARQKHQAIMWCRNTHHDGSRRGRIWVTGYHRWGRVIAGLTRRSKLMRRFIRYTSDCFISHRTGTKNFVGAVIYWGWVTPLSYALGWFNTEQERQR